MSVSTSIGQRFTQLIHHLGLSKNAFAQSLDKTATVIQHLVDERNKPGYDLLCKVFEAYPNVSKDWLLLGQGDMLVGEPPALVAARLAPPISGADSGAVAPTREEPNAAKAAATLPEPAPVAPVVPAPSALAPPSPDANYLAVVWQTQHLQHQLALAEQRNQHLLEQQALMQQLVAVLQGR